MNGTLTLRNDYLFKRLLGAEENKVCLQDFLECAGIPHYKKLETFYNQHTPALRVRINPSHESLIQCFYFLYGQTGCFCDIVNR